MISYSIYPDELPLPSSNFNGTYVTPTQTTQFTSGKRRRRKIGRTAIKKATLEWLFTPDEYDLWEVFFRTELDDGCSPFRINMPTGGSSQTGEHVVQCVGDYSYGHEECNWRVSVECVIYPYPRKDEGDLLDGYLGGSSIDMAVNLNKYMDRGYM